MSSKETFIERCPHDNENPYAQISRNLIRDQSISPECRWLLIYLLSMEKGWKISAKQIWQHAKGFIGRDKVWKLIKEACEAGYMNAVHMTKGNLRMGVKYYLSELPKFKNSNNFSDALVFSAPKLSAPKISARKKEHSKERTLERNPPLTPPSPPAIKKESLLSPEEEEIIDQRVRDRKSNEPIVKMNAYKKAVRENFLADKQEAEKGSKILLERVLKHKAEAYSHDLKTYKGFKVYALDDRVECTYPTGRMIVIPYSVTDEEWKKKIVWS